MARASRREPQGSGVRSRVPEGDPDAAVRLREDLRRHVAAGQLVACGQDDGIALDAEGAQEDDRIPLAKPALRVLVGLLDQEPHLAAVLRHRARQVDADVVRIEIGARHSGPAGFLARHDLETQRLAGHAVGHALAARLAPLADRVEEDLGARRDRRDLVEDVELRGLGFEELVLRVLVGLGALGARRRRRGDGRRDAFRNRRGLWRHVSGASQREGSREQQHPAHRAARKYIGA